MEMPTDDELYRVDDVFLGPPGMTLPFRARYRAIGVGGLVAAVLLFLEAVFGAINVINVLYALTATYGVTTYAMRVIDHERTVRSTLAVLAHEVTAPRRKRRPVTVYRPGQAAARRTR